MIFDRQSAAVAERRPAERAINTIAPTRTMAPSRIHSQMRLVPDPALDVGELLGCAVDALGLGEEVVGLGLGEEVLGLGLGEEVPGLGLGEEVLGLGLGVVEVPALWLGEMLTLRLGTTLAIELPIEPPQPAVKDTARMTAKRKKLCV